MYTDYEEARDAFEAQVEELVAEFSEDDVDIDEGSIANDLLEGFSMDCSDEVTAELYRCAIGWLPGGMAMRRPEVARIFKQNGGW